MNLMDDNIRFACPACGKRLKAPPEYAGRRVRCFCGERVIAPADEPARPDRPVPAPIPEPEHTLGRFPAGLVVFLGLITFNAFTVLRLLWLHGRLPKRRPSDPSAAAALVRAFLPFVNIAWVPHYLLLLVTRLNEQRREAGLPELRVRGLVIAYILCTFVAFSGVLMPIWRWLLEDIHLGMILFFGGPILNTVLIVPLLGSAIQNGANALAELAAARRARPSPTFLVQLELKWRARNLITIGAYLCVVAFLHISVITTVLSVQRFAHDGVGALLANFFTITVPLLLLASPLFGRAMLMLSRRARLDREPDAAAEVIAAECRTTAVCQLIWGGLLAFAGLAFTTLLFVLNIVPEITHRDGLHMSQVIDSFMTPMVAFVVPVCVLAAQRLQRGVETFARPADFADSALGLQAAPMPRWPLALGGLFAAFFILVCAIGLRLGL